MAKLQHLLLAVLTTQIYVSAAPSDVAKIEDKAKAEHAGLEEKPLVLEDSHTEETDAPQGQRQKRWFDYFGGFGGFPPVAPVVYPHYAKRDQSQNTGVYGLVEDPLTHVYRRLQGIAAVSRQQAFAAPQLPPQFPLYLPVIYIPQACNCQPPATSETEIKNGSTPDSVNTRFPEMEDTRQNWGFVIDENEDNNGDQDYKRPLNFDTIPPPPPPPGGFKRPPPPVEHGTSQGGGSANSIPAAGRPPSTTARPPVNLSTTNSPNDLPTNCDAAVLSCCHRPEVTFDCFSSQGCPDVAAVGDPCEASLLLRVVERFQRFYAQRTNG